MSKRSFYKFPIVFELISNKLRLYLSKSLVSKAFTAEVLEPLDTPDRYTRYTCIQSQTIAIPRAFAPVN